MGFNRDFQGKKPRQLNRRSSQLPNWVLPGKLAIGSLPEPGDSALLKDAGITAVVSLCAPSEGKLPEDVIQAFRCLRFILPDSSFVLGIQPQDLVTVLEVINEQIQQGEAVYVHCLAGVERSPTVCTAYLCLYEKLELWEAVSQVKKVHPYALPTEDQLRVIRYLLVDHEE
ncbi:MAG: dual specificity protein phosphatase family protein [Synechococcales cyanobacterium T60_A2020_003]|nr:dual specificity protein phosphatase family protein [Synechococcales cyanobacterium T60_A2020_003]